MKNLKKVQAMECALTLVYEEDGRLASTDVMIDEAYMVVTSQSFAFDIREAEKFAEEKLIPECTVIPYHPLFQGGYGDERYLIGAAGAQRFYRGDDADDVLKKLEPFFPKAYRFDPTQKVIDFDLRGNQAILFLGKANLEDYSGEGWNERMYEFSAGKVDHRYVEDAVVLNFPADFTVCQACEAQDVCPELGIVGNVSKNELRANRIPCILYSRDGRDYRKICFDDIIGDVVREADVIVSKMEHLV